MARPGIQAKDKENAAAVLEGMARALWVYAYADWVENEKPAGVERARDGADWNDVAPETPEAANLAATELAALFDAADNEMMRGRRRYTLTMDVLWTRALEAMTGIGKYPPRTTPWDLGFDLASQALGSGASWFDDHDEFQIAFPRFECHFDGDELVWSGSIGATVAAGVPRKGRRNPGKRWFYVFYYESGRTKEYWGPFADRKEAVAIRDKERAKYPALKAGYKLESLTDAEFERVWGVPPKNNPELPHNWPSSEVQSLLFPKDKYTVEGAKKWAEEHGYAYGKVDSHGSYHRLRQHAPEGGPCRTIEFGAGIKAVVCSKGVGKPPGVPNPETFEQDLEHWDD